MLWKTLAFALVSIALTLAPNDEARADFVGPNHPLMVGFTLQMEPGAALPIVAISFTVGFERSNPLNPGEGYATSVYAMDGTFLGSDSYFNETAASNIIGCACTDVDLNPFLGQVSFYILISSLQGTFGVTDVVALAYNSNDGYGYAGRAVGAIPEPGSLLLTVTGLAGLALIRRRHRDYIPERVA